MKLARSTTLSPEKMWSVMSASMELRYAFLEEGAGAFPLVRGRGANAEVGGLEGAALALARLEPLVHGLEGELDRDRRIGRDLRQDRLCARDEIRRRHNLVDEADAMRLLGADRPAGKNELQRAALSDQARQALRAAGAGQQAELDFGLAELRRLRGDPEGAGERRLAAAAEREAVHRGDHGFAEVLDQLEHALSEAARLPPLETPGVGELA